jgi:hypothetical protein
MAARALATAGVRRPDMLSSPTIVQSPMSTS